MRLSWGDEPKDREEWKKWKYWSYIENTKEQFDLEELIGLITKPHMLTVPDEIDMAVDSKGNLWIIYRANDGAIYLARANDTLDDWVYHERLLYVPSGSTYPTIVFDNNDRHVIAVEFLPAGSDQKEIWLYEPPYAGDGIRRIALGEMPLLLRDWYGRHFVFYKATNGNIEYRSDDDEYGTATLFEYASGEDVPIGARTPIYPINDPYHIQFQNILFYGNPLTTPKYALTAIEDFYTVGITFVVMHKGRPLSNVSVKFNNETVTTGSDGTATFLRVPWGVTLPYSFTHPTLGEGTSASFDVLASFQDSFTTGV